MDVLSAFTSENTTTSTTDVLAIGDGSNDASELAALLKGQIGPAARAWSPTPPPGRLRGGRRTGCRRHRTGCPSPVTLDPAATTAAPTRKGRRDPAVQAGHRLAGQIDCTGAVSCHTDPVTNITTVTFPTAS